jgi:hypothetical protein
MLHRPQHEEYIMRAAILIICTVFSFALLPAYADELVDEDGCVYSDTPICYKPSDTTLTTTEEAASQLIFEHWVIEKVEKVSGICIVTFHPLSESDWSLHLLKINEGDMAQYVFADGKWLRWMDFDIQTFNTDCVSNDVAV